MAPTIAVVLPTYNRAHCLGRALDSVRAQTREHWELFVVDDGSTDGTAELVKQAAEVDPRIHLLSNQRRPGAAGARNTAIEATHSEFIAFIDSDDRWEPHHLATVGDYLDRHEAVDLVGADALRVDRRKNERKTATAFLGELLEFWKRAPGGTELFSNRSIIDDPTALAAREEILSFVIGGFVWIQTPAVLLRRRAVDRWGLFNEELSRTEDFDFWLRVSGSGCLGFVSEVTAEIDVSGQDAMEGDRYDSYETARRTSTIEETRQHFEILRAIVDDKRRTARGWAAQLSPAQRRFAVAQMNYAQREIGYLCQEHDRLRAAWHYLQAIRYRPRDLLYLATKPREYLAEP